MSLQNTASNPNNSVFVAASAGSGKTTVLTNRVLRLLLLGTSPSKILCLTFTKVAANEMQNRILSKLEDWAIFDDEKLKKQLEELTGKAPNKSDISSARKLFAKLLDDQFGIQISTIHSFCQNIIQKFPVEANTTPNFNVIDEQKESELLGKARQILLREALTNSDLAQKINLISAKLNENSFLEVSGEMLLKRENLAFLKDKYFDINGVIEALFKRLGINQDENEETFFNDFVNDENWQKKELLKLFLENEIKGFEAVNKFINSPNFIDLENYIKSFLTEKNEPRKKVAKKSVTDKNPEIENIISSEQNRILEFLEKLNNVRIAVSTSALLIVTDRIIEIYTQIKNKEGYLDYSDLIVKTSDLLENSANREWIKYKMDGTYEHILVDESQDTNHLQWKIVQSITEEFFAGEGSAKNQNPSIFIVGDEKQSIYSFQGAEPDIFSDIFYFYQEKLSLVNQKLLNVELNTSYRSYPAILQVVDQTFAKPELKNSISKLSPQIKHQANNNKSFGKVELLPIVAVKKDKEEKDNEYKWNLNFTVNDEEKEREILAKLITKKIKSFFDENKLIAGRNNEKIRPIKFSDIMILLVERKSDLENLIIDNLAKSGIPAVGADKINFSKNLTVADLISIAKFILLPKDDLNLACLLKSPFFEISEDELFNFCQIKNEQNISLFESIRKSNQSLFSELEYLIEEYKKQHFSVAEFFSYILNYKNKNNFPEEIINQFLSVIINYENNYIGKSLQDFIYFLENSDLDIKVNNFEQNQNKVYITTIHSSKGLEAPIIFIADAVHDWQKQYGNDQRRIFWDYENQLPFWSGGAEFDNQIIKNIKNHDRENNKKEYFRKLYVAMTRAKEELYICGYGEKYRDDCWYEVVKNAITENAKQIDKSSFGEDFENYLINDGLSFGDEFKNENIIPEIKNEFEQKNKNEIFDKNLIDKIPQNENEEKFIFPSKLNDLENSNEESLNLGKIIHKIFEIIISSKLQDSKQQEGFIDSYLSARFSDQNLINNAKIRIKSALNQYTDLLFNPNAKSEVPIIAKIDEQIISGKIDLLIIEENQITIIDFKTGKQNDEKYQGQLISYEKALMKIYPNKKIGSKIIMI